MALTQAYSSICPRLAIAAGATADATCVISDMEAGDVIDCIIHVSAAADVATLANVQPTSATVVDGGFSLDFTTSADQLIVHFIKTGA